MSIKATLHSKWRRAAVQVHPRRSWLRFLLAIYICRRIPIWQSVIKFDLDPETCLFRFLPPFYCLRKGIPFHITTMSFRPIASPNELGAPEWLRPLHGWTSAIWPPYRFTASPFFLSTWRGGLFRLGVWGRCTTDWYVHDGMKRSIDVMYVMNYLGASANRRLGGSNSFRSTGRSNCLISQNLDWY